MGIDYVMMGRVCDVTLNTFHSKLCIHPEAIKAPTSTLTFNFNDDLDIDIDNDNDVKHDDNLVCIE